MGFIKGFFKFIIHSFFMSAVLSLSISVLAEELSSVDSDALNKTMALLKDKAQRQTVIDNNDGAKQADGMAKNLMGEGVDLEKIYAVAAELFRNVATDSNGDSSSMMETLSRAQKNPEAFYNNLNDEQKKMIQSLGKSIEDKNKQATP